MLTKALFKSDFKEKMQNKKKDFPRNFKWLNSSFNYCLCKIRKKSNHRFEGLPNCKL